VSEEEREKHPKWRELHTIRLKTSCVLVMPLAGLSFLTPLRKISSFVLCCKSRRAFENILSCLRQCCRCDKVCNRFRLMNEYAFHVKIHGSFCWLCNEELHRCSSWPSRVCLSVLT
jgi:hypothetical protein